MLSDSLLNDISLLILFFFLVNFRAPPIFIPDILYLPKSVNLIYAKVFSIIVAKRKRLLTKFLFFGNIKRLYPYLMAGKEEALLNLLERRWGNDSKHLSFCPHPPLPLLFPLYLRIPGCSFSSAQVQMADIIRLRLAIVVVRLPPLSSDQQNSELPFQDYGFCRGSGE
jgi:hypothetical protein